jgi:hypothetical protein
VRGGFPYPILSRSFGDAAQGAAVASGGGCDWDSGVGRDGGEVILFLFLIVDVDVCGLEDGGAGEGFFAVDECACWSDCSCSWCSY